MTKEQEPIELTTKPVDSTLNVRGNIIMPVGEPGSPEQKPPEIKKAKDTVEHLAEIKRRAELEELRTAPIHVEVKHAAESLAAEESDNNPGPINSEGNSGGTPPPDVKASPAPEDPDDKREDDSTKKLDGLSVDQIVTFSKKGKDEKIMALKVIFRKAVGGELDEDMLNDVHKQIMGNEEDQQNEAQREGEELRKGRRPEEEINEVLNTLLNTTDKDIARKAYEKFIRNVRVAINPYKKSDVPVGEELSDAFEVLTGELDNFKKGKLNSTEDFKQSAQKILKEGKLVKFFENKVGVDPREYKSRDPYPESLDHLITLIMASEGDEWEVGGDRELKNGKEEIQMNNVLAWIREKIDDVTEFNPDSPVNLFGEIYIPTQFRQITIGEIIQQVRYFRKDINGVLDKDSEYTKLKDAMLYEVWFAMKNHSYDAEYRQVMGQEEEAVKTLVKNHYEGVFTKDKTRLYNMFTFASTTAEGIVKIKGVDISVKGGEVLRMMNGEKRESAGVGQAMRKILLAYYHMGEIGASEEELGFDEEALRKAGLSDGEIAGERKRILNSNMFEKTLNDGDPEGANKFYMAILDKLIADKFRGDLFYEENGERINLVDLIKDENTEIIKWNIKHPNNKKAHINLTTELLNGRGGFDLHQILSTKDKYSQDEHLNASFDDAYLSFEQAGGLADAKKLTEWMLRKTFILKADDIEGLKALNIYGQFGRRADFGALVKEGLRTVFQERENLSNGDIRYAHNRAFALTYWTGISARNDIGAIGFDGSSKMMNFSEYRLRQMGKGASGDEENIFGLRRIMLNMWEALRITEDKTGADKSLIELLQGGTGDNISTSNLISEFEFSEGNAQRQFAVNHLASALNLYQIIMKERGLDFKKMFHRGQNGKLVVNPQEVDNFRRGMWKSLRYGLDFGLFFYDRKERSWWKEDMPIKDEHGKIREEEFDDGKGHKEKRILVKRGTRYGTRRLQDLMFNKDITHMNTYRLDDDRKRKDGMSLFEDSFKDKQDVNGKTMFEGEGDNKKPRKALRHMSRNVLGYLIGKELWKHRDIMSLEEEYSEDDIETVKAFFTNFNMEITEDPETGETKGLNPLFNEKDWNTIAKMSRTTSSDLRRTRLTAASAEIMGGGIGDVISIFTKSLAKAA